MSQLNDEISKIDLNDPDVQGSEILQHLFDRLDNDAKSSGADATRSKQLLAALAHPYKLSHEATQDIQKILERFNPNQDDTATGREIADAMLSVSNEEFRKMIPTDIPKNQQDTIAELFSKAKAGIWGAACGVETGQEAQEQKTQGVFKKITGKTPAEIESMYHELWTFERTRQNPLLRWAFLDKGDMQDLGRLPPHIMEILPPFVQIPDRHDICNALKADILSYDPDNPIIAAEDDPKKVKEELKKVMDDISNFGKIKKPENDLSPDNITFEDGTPTTIGHARRNRKGK